LSGPCQPTEAEYRRSWLDKLTSSSAASIAGDDDDTVISPLGVAEADATVTGSGDSAVFDISGNSVGICGVGEAVFGSTDAIGLCANGSMATIYGTSEAAGTAEGVTSDI